MPTIIVAPVVVSPDIDSKIASVMDRSGVSESISGTLPVIPRPTQKRTTTTNPSRKRNSSFMFLTGNHKSRPIERISANAEKKGPVVPSELNNEMISGGNIVRLNRESSIPKIL